MYVMHSIAGMVDIGKLCVHTYVLNGSHDNVLHLLLHGHDGLDVGCNEVGGA